MGGGTGAGVDVGSGGRWWGVGGGGGGYADVAISIMATFGLFCRLLPSGRARGGALGGRGSVDLLYEMWRRVVWGEAGGAGGWRGVWVGPGTYCEI